MREITKGDRNISFKNSFNSILMGTEYEILFAPNVGGIAIIKDEAQVSTLTDEEIDVLIRMLEELKG